MNKHLQEFIDNLKGKDGKDADRNLWGTYF